MKEQPIKIKPREQRKYNLTPLGKEAVQWLIDQEKKALEQKAKRNE